MTTTDATTATERQTTTTTQVHKVYIRASAQQIWDALTKPEWTNRYGYTGYAEYDLRPGGRFRVVPNDEFRAGAEAAGVAAFEEVVDGEVLVAEAPYRLVQTWRLTMDPSLKAEGFSKRSYEIKDLGNGSCSLTVVHELDGMPKTAAQTSGSMEDLGAGGGTAWILSDLKSLLETGRTLAG